MRIPEHHAFLFPGWTSFSSCTCISIFDFKASFSCSSSEVEGNICSNHGRVVFPRRSSPGAHSCGSALGICCCSAARQERAPQARRDKDQMGNGTAKTHGLQRRRRKASQEGARTGTCLLARSIGGSNALQTFSCAV